MKKDLYRLYEYMLVEKKIYKLHVDKLPSNTSFFIWCGEITKDGMKLVKKAFLLE